MFGGVQVDEDGKAQVPALNTGDAASSSWERGNVGVDSDDLRTEDMTCDDVTFSAMSELSDPLHTPRGTKYEKSDCELLLESLAAKKKSGEKLTKEDQKAMKKAKKMIKLKEKEEKKLAAQKAKKEKLLQERKDEKLDLAFKETMTPEQKWQMTQMPSSKKKGYVRNLRKKAEARAKA
eukprot:TRINITY_DN13208_c0_g1_i1.p1 TRINITY_DN13208_c0_g1~~TRINITY_DN13208_c0_g1_i1.p1  ORF type:complete len:187 (-),score=83.07 TRINITY_DN13208_c0_g1_i1:449-982(-)